MCKKIRRNVADCQNLSLIAPIAPLDGVAIFTINRICHLLLIAIVSRPALQGLWLPCSWHQHRCSRAVTVACECRWVPREARIGRQHLLCICTRPVSVGRINHVWRQV